MRNILLVDDEMLVRIGLKTMYPWEDKGYQIVDEAKNGLEALNLLKKKKYDLVITDISMPIMDGFELINKIKEYNIPVKIIILTHFDEFEYARQAINYGISNYILKSELTIENITNVISTLFKDSDIQNTSINSDDIFRENLLNMIQMFVKGDYSNKKEFNSTKEILALSDEKSSYILVTGTVFLENTANINNINQTYKTIKHIFMDSFSKKGVEKIFFNNDKKYLAIIYSKDKKNDLNLDISKYISKFDENVYQFIHCKTINVISEIFNEIENFYFEATKNQEKLLKSYFMDAKIDDRAKSFHLDLNFFNSILLKKNYEEIYKYLNLVFNHMVYVNSIFYSYKYFQNIYYLLKEAFNDISISDKDNRFCSNKNPFKDYYTFESHKKIVVDFLENYESQATSKNDYSYLISKAIKFISNNYFKEISLDILANDLSVSSGYLSSLFSKEVGINLTNYINQTRVEQSKFLLKTTTKKIYEIAELVGFNNQYYFSKIFKETTGITSKEYRNLYYKEEK